jgi:hypothetical protein
MIAAKEAMQARAARALRSIEQAAEVHQQWLQNRASSTIPDRWHAAAQREAEEAARSEAELIASVRALREAERLAASGRTRRFVFHSSKRT